GANEARNVILDESTVTSIILKAYEESEEFGLFVEVSAVTGARSSQIARLTVQDLQDDGLAPRLMMPSSRKGGPGQKKIARRPVPIPPALSLRLRAAASNRHPDAALLLKGDGEPWGRNDHRLAFARAVKAAGRDPAEATIYSLRHSSIARQL